MLLLNASLTVERGKAGSHSRIGWQLDDVGLIKGVSRNYFGGEPVSCLDIRELAQAWQPWRSVATWYIWRSLDPLPVVY